MKKILLAVAAVFVVILMVYGAGTTVNGTRTINGDLTVKGTCTGCGSGGSITYGACGSLPAPGSGNNGNIYVGSEAGGGYVYYGASNVWNAKFGPFVVTVPPSSWTSDNSGTVDHNNCYEYMTSTSAAGTVRISYNAISGDHTLTAAMMGGPPANLTASTGYGIYLGDSGAKWIGMVVYTDASAFTRICFQKWTTTTSASSNTCAITTYSSNLFTKDVTWFRAIIANPNITFQFSIDGSHWTTYSGTGGATTCTDFLAACPSKAGWGTDVSGGANETALVSWSVP